MNDDDNSRSLEILRRVAEDGLRNKHSDNTTPIKSVDNGTPLDTTETSTTRSMDAIIRDRLIFMLDMTQPSNHERTVSILTQDMTIEQQRAIRSALIRQGYSVSSGPAIPGTFDWYLEWVVLFAMVIFALLVIYTIASSCSA